MWYQMCEWIPALAWLCIAVAMGTTWVPFWVMVLIGSWCWPNGACCTMVTIWRGVVAVLLWMILLAEPIEPWVMPGTDSTFTKERTHFVTDIICKNSNQVKLHDQSAHLWPPLRSRAFLFLWRAAGLLRQQYWRPPQGSDAPRAPSASAAARMWRMWRGWPQHTWRVWSSALTDAGPQSEPAGWWWETLREKTSTHLVTLCELIDALLTHRLRQIQISSAILVSLRSYFIDLINISNNWLFFIFSVSILNISFSNFVVGFIFLF